MNTATDGPPLLPSTQRADSEHLKLLVIFHFIVAGLGVLGLFFLFAHYMLFHFISDNPEIWKHPANGSGPTLQIFLIFRWFYVFIATILVAGVAANVASAIYIRQRRNRLFSLVIAALNLFHLPFGTALGLFTLVVLSRDSVRSIYHE